MPHLCFFARDLDVGTLSCCVTERFLAMCSMRSPPAPTRWSLTDSRLISDWHAADWARCDGCAAVHHRPVFIVCVWSLPRTFSATSTDRIQDSLALALGKPTSSDPTSTAATSFFAPSLRLLLRCCLPTPVVCSSRTSPRRLACQWPFPCPCPCAGFALDHTRFASLRIESADVHGHGCFLGQVLAA